MMKSLDIIEQEKREREAGEALLSAVMTDDQSQRISPTGCDRKLLASGLQAMSQQPESQPESQPEPQPEPQPAESGSERLFTKEEVRQIVSAAVARERVNVECREYLLSHYYGMDHVSKEIDSVLRILEPKSVEDLEAKMSEVVALDAANGAVTSTSASPRSAATSLRQIFVRN